MDNLNDQIQAIEAEAKARAYGEELANAKAQAGIAGGNLYAGAGRDGHSSDPAFALEAAAAVTRTLENFYPGAFALQSRPLTRGEKIAALRAAIATYEHLDW